MSDGFIYAVEDGNGAVKLGWSAAPQKRFQEIQVSSAQKYTLAGFIAGSRQAEKELHGAFDGWRIRGEWFHKAGPVESFVNSLSIPSAPKAIDFVGDFSAGRITIQEILGRERGLKFRLAGELGITHGAVSQWSRVPAERVLDVERITGISRYDLRPDLYGEAANG